MAQTRPCLAVEIGQIKHVKIGDGKFSDTQPGQRQHMTPPHAPQTRNDNPLGYVISPPNPASGINSQSSRRRFGTRENSVVLWVTKIQSLANAIAAI